jgi:hypothetical protein
MKASMRKRFPTLQRRGASWIMRATVATTIALSTRSVCGADLAPPPPSTMPAAEVLFYQGYDLLKLEAAQFAKGKFPEERKRGWQLIEQAAAQGNPKALRGMGAYWASHGDLAKAKSFDERAMAAGDAEAVYQLSLLADHGADAGASAELRSALGVSGNREADRLLLKSAEMGFPDAQQAWCARHHVEPGSSDGARCDTWWKEGAARGNGAAWGSQGRRDDKDRSVVALAYDEGNAIAGGGLSPMAMEEGSAKHLDDDSPYDRCASYLGHITSRFLYVFNEQLCVPPRAQWPAWRGLGKNFKGPPASAESERLYQRALKKLAQQDMKGGGELLKKAADLGNTGAMINLALVYFSNPDQYFPLPETVNASKPSYSLLTKADAAGDIRAHYLLAFANDLGVSVPFAERADKEHASFIAMNRLKAEKLEVEAAQAGLPRAQYGLAWRLIREERTAEGWDWLKKSFDSGERIAGFDLYRIAHYLWKDDAQALRYLHESALQGELASVDLLAQALDQGQLGQARNPVRAQCYRGVVDKYKSQTWEERLDLRLPDLDRICP